MEQEQPDQAPRCPGCGGHVAAVLTQTLEYHVEDQHRTGQPISVLIVYKCPCGRAFTQREKFFPPTTDSELAGG